MKIFKWIWDNILFLITLFLLAFIPLYPKLPLVDIQHTWVYIRAEDFVVVLVLLIWIILMLFKKVNLKTPLTLPIILFWIVGAVSTIHGILLIFPKLSDVFPNVAFLSYLRRLEYMSLFFVAYSSMKDKRYLIYIVALLAITLFLVFGYGIGQKYYGLPAFLTMNEEFAKGTPIRLSQLSRISSTFGGHYDLAAYLVLVLPILASMIFGFKNWIIKFFLLTSISSGFVLLFMTVSRISFFVLLFSMFIVLLFQKKRLAVLSILLITPMLLILLILSPSLWERFGNTVKKVDVLVSTTTGEEIGHVKEVPAKYLENKIVKMKFAQNKNEIIAVTDQDTKFATMSGIVAISQLPQNVPLLEESYMPTGENLPQGTGYINLPLSPIVKRLGSFYYELSPDTDRATDSASVLDVRGDFLVKRALAYDLSFTTRFQGEWPRTIDAFKRNVIFGSGYSSVSLAVDNNYLRILGEVGLLGFFSFFGIFLIIIIYISKTFSKINSPVEKSFIIGFISGLFGLALNAIFIDVFEASKIAFLFWLLVGITLGILDFYKKDEIDSYKEIKKVLTSSYAIILYLFIATIVVFSPILKNYFIGDDFTWLRWSADCNCKSIISTIFQYFTDANGFFYRPGTRIYFLLMYSGFWLNQTMYYMISIFLHFIVAMLLFLISKKVLNDFKLSILAAFLFLILSGYFEAVFWISSTGFLFNALFTLLSLLFYIMWHEKKNIIYFFVSFFSIIFSLMFHELGVVVPLILIIYEFSFKEKFTFAKLIKNFHNLILLSPLIPYLALRFFANSHWFNGDYSYNLLKLPYNIIGNIIGYLILTLFGPISLSFYQTLRSLSREHIAISILVSVVVMGILILLFRIVFRKLIKKEQQFVTFGVLFFLVSLLPFLGLGNITSRYSYLSSVAFILLFVFFITKLYKYMLSINGRNISIAVTTIAICIFFLIHFIQLQKIQGDWREASEKTKRFLVSIDSIYSEYLTKGQMKLYFINVPIRQGDAWVFPVGIEDALWFVFKNQNISIYKMQSLNQVLNTMERLPNEQVFEFDDKGKIIKREIPQNTTIIPIKY